MKGMIECAQMGILKGKPKNSAMPSKCDGIELVRILGVANVDFFTNIGLVFGIKDKNGGR